MTVVKRFALSRDRRRFRVRNKVRRYAHGRPRLSVFRSNKHMYAQIIDDATGRTIASASTVESELFGAGKYAGNKDAAAKVGQVIAERAKAQGIEAVAFDRGVYKYHGRVAALAEAARAGGLQF
ncbi:MAG: 50S ribosomal protein L18 [Planctomycetota bacterium]|nr:50S ribosomal protein L18 [Planctomycetaceae bacterium]MDQ3330074.1 50S ribosomal protein L18 [Planctomycetota bacterium]